MNTAHRRREQVLQLCQIIEIIDIMQRYYSNRQPEIFTCNDCSFPPILSCYRITKEERSLRSMSYEQLPFSSGKSNCSSMQYLILFATHHAKYSLPIGIRGHPVQAAGPSSSAYATKVAVGLTLEKSLSPADMIENTYPASSSAFLPFAAEQSLRG
jgi:hypothetical protein